MKKIIFTIIVFLIVFIIYYFNISEKVYYVSIGDFLSLGVNNQGKIENSYSDNIKNKYKDNLDNYVNYSFDSDYRVMDLINDINNNRSIIYDDKEYKIQNLLIKANFITISIGMNDLIYKFKTNNLLIYDYTDDLINDMETLLKLIRKYNKDQIYLLSFYNIINNESLIKYANERLEIICNENKIKFINIEGLKNYIYDIYPTNDGYVYITDRILNFTKS